MHGTARILILVFCVSGCGTSHEEWIDEYKATHRSARTSIPWAVQMEELFPADTSHFITHYRMNENNVWNSEAFFSGRYQLTMQVVVRLNYENNTVEPVGNPTFFLMEVEKVNRLTNGNAEAIYGNSWEFSKEDWELATSQGELDVSRIGIQIDLSPTDGIDFLKQEILKDRIKISLR